MNAWPGRSVPCKVLRPASPRLSSPVFLPREEKNASPRVRRFSLATPAHSLLTLPPYFLLSLFRYIPLSVETLRATSPFGYVRDACNVSVWIVSGYVGDVARYVSTGWWNRGMGRFPPIHPDRCYVYIIIKFIYKYIIYNIRARVETYGPYVRRYLMGVCESKQ